MYACSSTKCKDACAYVGFRLFQVYVLTDDAKGDLRLMRFNTKIEGRAELVAEIDTFDSSSWDEPLRLLQINPRESAVGLLCCRGRQRLFFLFLLLSIYIQSLSCGYGAEICVHLYVYIFVRTRRHALTYLH